MALPLLATQLLTMNARVNSFLVGEGQDSREVQSGSGQLSSSGNLESQIEEAYKQIFFHAFKVDRDPALESQLRNGQITMRDFIRGLLLSRKFRDDFYRCNSNYRMVEQVVNRVLGRPVHGNRERLAYSIVIAQHGLQTFIDTLLNSEEYMDTFGYNTIPYQRSRTLAGQALGTMPFNQQAPRYDSAWRDKAAMRAPAKVDWQYAIGQRPAWLANAPAPWAQKLWLNTVATGGFVITGLVLWIAVTMLSTGAQ
ncbi:MAG: phycobilisome rod-core linker polypeptide [Cyanobacteria bacterium]|nr:phycobilisome rod-core linker polypeptide [Cyanobacteriota bacterium]